MLRSAHRSPHAATSVRGRSVRTIAGAVVALAALTLSGLMFAPSASAAGWGACYRQNSWSFKHYTGSANTSGSYIDAWHNTTCSGSSILSGQVRYTTSNRHVTIVAYDYKADNYGVIVYTHGPSVSSNGSGSSVTGGGNLSSFSTPYNFWIRVGGQQNSVSQPFPLS
jgi:hypothetical protein